jgi:general secretion pathway protein G
MRSESGFTLLEMVVTATILMILAGALFPAVRMANRRRKELELRRDLRILRTAIDRYHVAAVQGMIGGTDLQLGNEGYPKDLDQLVKGVSQAGKADRKLKFLRQIPVDPMTGNKEWALKCYQDEPDSQSWCGENVWDVHTKAGGKGLDGTSYKDW